MLSSAGGSAFELSTTAFVVLSIAGLVVGVVAVVVVVSSGVFSLVGIG